MCDSVTNGFKLVTFIWYHTMHMRAQMSVFFKVKLIRPTIGPRDLGPVDSRGDTFPELTARSSVESTEVLEISCVDCVDATSISPTCIYACFDIPFIFTFSYAGTPFPSC